MFHKENDNGVFIISSRTCAFMTVKKEPMYVYIFTLVSVRHRMYVPMTR